MNSPFHREHEILDRARRRASEHPGDEEFARLADDYAALLRQAEKIVRMGDATQNKLLRAQRMLERAIQFHRQSVTQEKKHNEQEKARLSALGEELETRAAPLDALIQQVGNALPESSKEAWRALDLLSANTAKMQAAIDIALDRKSNLIEAIVPVREWIPMPRLIMECVRAVGPSAGMKNCILKQGSLDQKEAFLDAFLAGEILEQVLAQAVALAEPGDEVLVEFCALPDGEQCFRVRLPRKISDQAVEELWATPADQPGLPLARQLAQAQSGSLKVDVASGKTELCVCFEGSSLNQ